MELSSPSSSSSAQYITQSDNIATVDSILMIHTNPLQNPNQTSKSTDNKKKKRGRISKPLVVSSSPNSSTQQRGLRVGGNSKSGGRRRDFDSLALPLGMSIAAFVAQVLDKKNMEDERMSTDRLSLICMSAVKESLENVFGDKVDRFVRNFGESFGCTLKTLRLVNNASLNNGEPLGRLSTESIYSEVSETTYLDVHGCAQNSFVSKSSACQSKSLGEHGSHSSSSALKSPIEIPSISEIYKSLDCAEEIPENVRVDSMNREVALHGEEINSQLSFVAPRKLGSGINSSVLDAFKSLGELEIHSSSSALKSPIEIPSISEIYKSLDCAEEIPKNVRVDSMNREVALHGEEINRQLSFVAPRKLGSGINGSMLDAFEKSVVEQTRSNDLKVFEIGLKMKELKMKETELALSSDSNHLDRCKLSMGISKVSFRAEKFKTELEETRHAELLKKCIDCLVAGLLIMCASLVYGACVFSRKRILEVTTFCISHKESKSSWWMPNQVVSVSSGIQWLTCQVTVFSRILFGVLMILGIAYLLLQRSSTSKQLMPVTHILMLLGFMCGITGKLCVDTLGGSGYTWFVYWEVLCLLHFLANVCTSMFYVVLHGSVSVTQGLMPKSRVPFWFRRFGFYSLTLVFLPLLCGLMPFAGPGDWMDHFISLAKDVFFASVHLEGG